MSVKYILIIIAVLCLVLFGFVFRTNAVKYYEAIKQYDTVKSENELLKSQIKDYQNTIKENDVAIDSLSKDRATLAKKIYAVNAKKNAIKNPQDVDEIVSRLQSLSLNPKVVK